MQPGETILSGGPSTCTRCKTKLRLEVLKSGGGFYLGTQCGCGPYSRESRYFPTRAEAEAALPAARILFLAVVNAPTA